MSLIASQKSGNFVPAPQGMHQGVCVDIIDLGVVDKGWGPKQMVRIVFQLSVTMESGKRFIASRDFNNTLNEKGNLLPFLTNWKGSAFSSEELNAFPLECLLGVNGNVQILHNEGKNGNTYANITSVVPLMVGQTPMANDGYIRMIDRPEQTAPQQPPPPRQPFPSGAQPPVQQQRPAPSQWANLNKPKPPIDDGDPIPF